MLKTVYFIADGKIAKAIVDEEHVPFFVGLGAMRTPKAAPARKQLKKQEKVDTEPVKKVKLAPLADKGSGETNSFQFHELKIKELGTFEELQKYTFDVTGKTIHKKSDRTLYHYRLNALRLIKGFLNADKSGRDRN